MMADVPEPSISICIETLFSSSYNSVQISGSLPYDITAASSLTVFRRKLKTHLFWQSYLDVIM